jgi:ABC-type transport system involved in cytochrome c biogenesis ATPase subunit
MEFFGEAGAGTSRLTSATAHTRNTKVGDDFVRGVSGGERKRVSIAEMALAGRWILNTVKSQLTHLQAPQSLPGTTRLVVSILRLLLSSFAR